MPVTTFDVLLIHTTAVVLTLVIVLVQLRKRGLWRWTSAGFWAWCGLMLFLAIPPALSLLQNDVSPYDSVLQMADGPGRALWITCVTLVGIASYFWVYMHAKEPRPLPGLFGRSEQAAFTAPQRLVLLFAIAIGLWSLVQFRSGFFQSDIVSVNGRTLGGANGYQYTAHLFLFVPVALFLLSASSRFRLVGYALAIVYVAVGSLDPYARWLQVCMLLMISLTSALRGEKRWPNPLPVAGAVTVGLVLALRGHTTFSSPQDVFLLVGQIPGQLTTVFTGGNTDFLSTWYLQSYVDDKLVGFNYGLVLLNYVLTGFVPGQLFHEKYFLIDWLHSQQPALSNQVIMDRLHGNKSSFIGTFYSEGGVFAVAFMSGIWGYLSRKMDGLILPESPILLKSLGIVWISMLWMVWGSGDYWALDQYYTVALPTIVLWFVAKERKRTATVKRMPAKRSQQLLSDPDLQRAAAARSGAASVRRK